MFVMSLTHAVVACEFLVLTAKVPELHVFMDGAPKLRGMQMELGRG
jgi:hypothetical protein